MLFIRYTDETGNMHPNSAGVEPVVPPELVRRYLAKVLANSSLAGAARLSRFLEYAVTETLAGNHAELKEFRLGMDVFDRPSSFDPKTDPVVRVAARQLRYKLAGYYAAEGQADEVVITIPKGGYSARFELVIQAAGTPAEAEVEPAEVVTGTPARVWQKRWWMGAVVAVLLALAAGVVWLSNRAGVPATEPQPSIAVLPFANLSSKPENEYFSDGLTNEVIADLSRMSGLRVIAGSSSFQFRGETASLGEVGRQLHVSRVLTGSVARDGDRVKIAVRLERVSDGALIRSRVYERQLSDVFAVQTELAAQIAADLGVQPRVRAAQQTGARDPRALDHYLRGRYEMEQFSRESLERAEKEYMQALKHDPNYAPAWYGLGAARHRRISVQTPDRQAIEGIREGYQKAAELNPEMADARAGVAIIAMQFDWDWDRAERELKAAGELAPSALVQSYYGVLLMIRGRPAEAEEYFRRALELDPLGRSVQINVAICRLYQGQYEAARRELERHATAPSARITLGYALVLEGRAEEALRHLQGMRDENPGAGAIAAMALAGMGKLAEARKLLGEVEAQHAEKGTAFYHMAMARAYLRDDEAALQWLDRSLRARESYLLALAVDPVFARLRTQAGFLALKVRMGLAR
jgi:serine/threonine-protein kinase